MASRGAIIASAAKAGRPTYAPQGVNFGQISPLAAQLANERGYAAAYGDFLPRPPMTFTSGAFGPFTPIFPTPVDEPPPGADRPEARRYEFQVGWNLPVGTPGTEGIKLADFSTLKTLADLYSVARTCIQLRKNEIKGLSWDILPTKDAAKAYHGDKGAMRDFGRRRAKMLKFWDHPDPDYFSFGNWLDAVLEEMFVFDALSLLIRPTWGKGAGKGVLGSDLDCLELINGPTIRPLVGLHGEVPRPPAPAYQQYLYGVPRSDYMTLITQRDIDEGGLTGAELDAYRGDQMLYLPMVPRRWTPYGFPPVERALIPVMSGLQKQAFQLDYFREGTVPAVYISPGDQNITPNQIRELQDALNAIAGDAAQHHKVIVLPPGSKVDPQRPTEIADQFDEIVMTQVCCVRGTEIITKRGLIAIETVIPGDEVLTHAGRWRPVTRVFCNRRNGRQVRRITANGFEPLEVTADHKLWAAHYSQTGSHRQVYQHANWKPAGKMQPRTYYKPGSPTCYDFDAVTLPVPASGSTDAVLRLPPEVTAHGRKMLPAEIPLDAAFGRLLGFYLAEGSATAGEVRWSFHEKEQAYQQQVIEDVRAVFGLEAKIRPIPEHHVTEVRCYSTALAALLACGTQPDRILPAWAWEGSADFYAALLQAWVSGDGCLTPTGWRGYTTSRNLAWQMRLIALACGHEAQLRTQKQPQKCAIQGRELHYQPEIYVVQVVLGKENRNGTGYADRRGTYRIEAGAWLTSPVRTNEASHYEGEWVYTLEVADDHSYTTTGGCAINCMAFDVNPMELGILPRVSAVASPFAAREMAQAGRTIHQRVSTKPLLKFLTDIFDGIMHRIVGQDDMKFTFEGLEEEEQANQVTDLLTKQVQFGLRSVDEARAELQLQPWNLPETSGPVYFSTMGPMPFTWQPGEGAPTGPGGVGLPQPPMAPGMPPPLANPEIGPAPTPGHEAAAAVAAEPSIKPGAGAPGAPTKAEQAEYEALARHILKGRDPNTWRPAHIPEYMPAVIAAKMAAEGEVGAAEYCKALVLGSDAYEWVEKAPKWPGREHDLRLITAYEVKIQAAFTRAIRRAADLIRRWWAGDLYVTRTSLVDLISHAIEEVVGKTYRLLWREAWHLGARAAQAAIDGSEPDLRHWRPGDARTAQLGRHLTSALATRGATWMHEIAQTRMPELEQAISVTVAAGEGPEELISRLADLLLVPSRSRAIAQTEVTRASAAAALEHFRSRNVTGKQWVTAGDSKVCPVCQGNEDEGAVPLDTLFQSGEIMPPAHPNCRCGIVPAGAEEVVAKGYRLQVDLDGQQVWVREPEPDYPAAGGGAPAMPDEPVAPGGRAGAEPPRWTYNDGSGPRPREMEAPQVPLADTGAGVHTAGRVRPPANGPAPAGPAGATGWWPRGGHGTLQPPEWQFGAGKRGVPPTTVGKSKQQRAKKFLADAPDVTAQRVYDQMRGNFPPKAIRWIKNIRWVGPVEVPLELIDFDSEDRWAAHHDVEHVKQFMREIKDGTLPDPGVGVVKPGHNRVRIVDGHHRTMAYRKLGRPARLYVGYVTAPEGPWDKTYLYQHHHGNDPQNKSSAVGKFAKSVVNYRLASQPYQRCGTCVMYHAHRCTLVAGDIETNHVCDRWEPREER